jgi:hypothetical protein
MICTRAKQTVPGGRNDLLNLGGSDPRIYLPAANSWRLCQKHTEATDFLTRLDRFAARGIFRKKKSDAHPPATEQEGPTK